MGRKLLALCLVLWAAQAAAAGVYKWVDENGRVHYGERPPAGGQAQELHLRDDSAQGIGMEPDRQEQQDRLLRAFDEEHAQQEVERKKSQEAAATRKRNCAYARDRLRRYSEATRIYDLDAQGNRRILDDAEHAATMQRAQEEVSRWCD